MSNLPPPVPLSSLSSWKDSYEEDEESENQENIIQQIDFEVKVPVNDTINSKIKIWRGKSTMVQVEAIVNATNEEMTNTSGVSGEIIQLAGHELVKTIESMDGCKPGEAKVTPSFSLPNTSKAIIHTVGPRYNEKYKTASENVLHYCYRNVFNAAVENNFRTIAFSPINVSKKGQPREILAHIALLTTRRFLEKWESSIDEIVFVMETLVDYEEFMKLMPIYFPRNEKELIKVKDLYPEDFNSFDENGERVIRERAIRIQTFPIVSEEKKNEPVEEDLKSFTASFEAHPDDHIRKNKYRPKTKQELENDHTDRIYSELLQQALKEDFSDVVGFMNFSSVDAMNRTLVIVDGSKFPLQTERDKTAHYLRYMIKIMDLVSKGEFIVIYFHSGMQKKQEPEFVFIKQLYKIWERKYTKNMYQMYIVHPTLWVRFSITMLKPWISKNFSSKLRFIKNLAELFSLISRDLIYIPDDAYIKDHTEFGSNFNLPDEKNEGL